MKVTIDRISNGFVIVIATQQGSQAIYKATWEEVVKELGEIKLQEQPTQTSGLEQLPN